MQNLRPTDTEHLVCGHAANGTMARICTSLSLLFPTHHALLLGINLYALATLLFYTMS